MLFLCLFAFYIILSGGITWEILLSGAVVCTLADLLSCKVLGFDRQRSRRLLLLMPEILRYMAMVAWEVIKANLMVMRIILSRDLHEMKPTLFSYDCGLKSELARTVLANSITITPGTYTVCTEGERLTVHRLGDGFDFDDESLCFNTRLKKLEEKVEKRHA